MNSKKVFWSPSEDRYIAQQMRAGLKITVLAERMQHRSISSISNRARKLGFSLQEKKAEARRKREAQSKPLIKYAGHPSGNQS